MPRLAHFLIPFSVGSLVATPAAAQGVAGTWGVVYDESIRDTDSGSTVTKGRARLVITRQGDSVTGIWQALPATGTTPAPRELRGTIIGDTARLTAPARMQRTRNGIASIVTGVYVYELVIAGDSLNGRIHTTIDGSKVTPRQVAATREKGE